MSSHLQPSVLTFKATAAIAKGCAVKAGADNQTVQICSAKTDLSIGITQNAALVAGDLVEVALVGGGSKAKLGGTVAFGDLLAPTTDGSLITTTTAGDRYVAMAMEAGVIGDLASVQMLNGLI